MKSLFREYAKVAAALIALAIVGLVAVLITVASVRGAAWLTEALMPIAGIAGQLATLLATIIFVPLSFFSKTRLFAGKGMRISAVVIGFALWLFAFVVTYKLWGVSGVVIGVLLMGLGVVLVAMFAAILHAEWGLFFNLILWAMLVAALLSLGNWLVHRSHLKTE